MKSSNKKGILQNTDEGCRVISFFDSFFDWQFGWRFLWRKAQVKFNTTINIDKFQKQKNNDYPHVAIFRKPLEYLKFHICLFWARKSEKYFQNALSVLKRRKSYLMGFQARPMQKIR